MFKLKSRQPVLCSLGIGEHAELLNIGKGQLCKWASYNRYQTDLRYESLDTKRPHAWSKVLLISELLNSNKFVIWVDADTVVVDPTHDISKLVCMKKPLAMVAHTYHDQWFPNTGVMAIRSTFFTRRLFKTLWRMEQFTEHKWWENGALLDLLGFDVTREPLKRIKKDLVGHRINWLSNSWNSMGLDPSSSPIIKHYPGVENDQRRIFMNSDVAATG
jgi:hypothetical protein